MRPHRTSIIRYPLIPRRQMLGRVGLVGGVIAFVQFAAARASAAVQALDPTQAAQDPLVGSWLVADTTPPGSQVNVTVLIHYAPDGGVVTSHTVPQAGGAQTPRDPQDPIFDPEMRNWRYHDTSGLGAWARTGDGQYVTTVMRLTADQQYHGSFAGSLRIRTALTLDASGDAWVGQSMVDVFSPSGQVVRTRSSTQRATRITAESAEAALGLAWAATRSSTEKPLV